MKYSMCFAVCLVFVSIFPSTYAARKAYLRVGSTTDIPSIGLKMRMPKDAVAKPMESLAVKTLTSTRGGKSSKIDTYYPEDLWIRDQVVGTYASSTVTVSVYDMSLPPPIDVPAIHKQRGRSFVLKEAYDEWKSKQQSEKWNDDKTVSWLKYLLGPNSTINLQVMKRGGVKRAVTTSMQIDDSRGTGFLYIIKPSKRPDKRFVIYFNISSELDIKKSIRGVGQCLTSVALYTPKQIKTDDKKITTGVRRSTKDKDRSPEYIASRDRVINNIKNLKGWWYLETDNFIFVANIKNKKTIRELHTNLERSRSVFSVFYPITEPLKAVSVAKAFETRKEYLGYVGSKYEWTGGLWMSDRKELVISPMNWGSTREKRDMMVNTIQHEGFHQYIYFATGEKETAVWFNEGNATFFEGLEFKGSRPVIEETKRISKAITYSKSANIGKLINMSYKEFYSNPDRNYPLGYALMFFLHKGAPIMKKKNNYHEIPTKYYEAIIKTRDYKKATEIAWAGVDMATFTSEFRTFWSNKSLIKRASHYDIIKAKTAKK